MNLLDPRIGSKISRLIHGITKERRDFIIEIAKSATDWQEFEARLNSGGFPMTNPGQNLNRTAHAENITRTHSLP